MWTRMSRFDFTVAVALAGLLSGCTAANPFWRWQPRQTVQAPTLPMVPDAAEYKSYTNAPPQPQFGQSCARGGECGSRGGCGCGSRNSGSGSCCSGGSCNANVAVGPNAPPQNQFGAGVAPASQMAQQNPSQPARTSSSSRIVKPVR